MRPSSAPGGRSGGRSCSLGLVDYGMGNLHSVEKSMARVGATCEPLGDGAALAGALNHLDALVLPGVGAFDPAMERLEQLDLIAVLRDWAAAGRPLLGICLGLQLLFEASEEGRRSGLGIFQGQVRALQASPGHPVPHMGWGRLLPGSPNPLLSTEQNDAWVYFVHSFAAVPQDPAVVAASVRFDDAVTLTAAVWRGQVGATQFHPEKSGPVGLAMLERWLEHLPR